MFTMGSDFNYESALEWYKNLDKLIRYVNKMVRFSLSFSLSRSPSFFFFLLFCVVYVMQDDPRLGGYNADKRAAQFVFLIGEQAVFYPSKHTMLTMGSDFNYENARENF